MDYIITKTPQFFEKIGQYNYCQLKDMILPETVAIDLETTELKPILGDIFAIQIGTGVNNYLIHCYDNNYVPQNIIPYLEDKILIGHNITFDLGFFYKYGFYPEKVKDTFIASKILYNGLKEYRHDFGTVFERELGINYDKSEQKNINKIKLSTSKSIEYCFNDVDRLIELYTHLETKIIEGGFQDTYNLHCEYIKALAYMEQCGVPLSKEKWLQKIELDKQVLKEKEQLVSNYITKNLPQFHQQQLDLFNTEPILGLDLTSPKQMIPVFQALKINCIDDEGKDSISENVIKKTKHEFVDIWLNYQSAKHDVTTFGNNIFEKVIDGRIYTGYNPILDTARISSRKGDVNTLNLPANQRTRECIEAKSGFKMIVADYEGQETRVGADITGDEAMIDSIINGSDLHCAFAKVLFPELQFLSDEEIIKNHKEKRTAAKAPRFAFAYGANAYTIHVNEGIPLKEAQKIEDAYKQLHSGIYEWGNRKLQEVLNLGYIESTMGFKLHLPDFQKFKELQVKVEQISKREWELYKEGKEEYRKFEKAQEQKRIYEIQKKTEYDYYIKNKSLISRFFKLKAQYYRLTLNNPVQATSSHQTKLAACMLFDYIKKNNHLGKVKICIIPHDEFVMEVEDELVELYKEKLGYFMREAGNKFIKNPLIKMNADANSAENWYKAK